MGNGSSKATQKNNSPNRRNAKKNKQDEKTSAKGDSTPSKPAPQTEETQKTTPTKTPSKASTKSSTKKQTKAQSKKEPKTQPKKESKTQPKTKSETESKSPPRTPTRTPSMSPSGTPTSTQSRTSCTTPSRTPPRNPPRTLQCQYETPAVNKSPCAMACKTRSPKINACSKTSVRSSKSNLSCEASASGMSDLREELRHIKHDLKKQKKYRAALALATIGSDCSVDTVYSNESIVDVHFYCKKKDQRNPSCKREIVTSAESSECDDDTSDSSESCYNSYTSDSSDSECNADDTDDTDYTEDTYDTSNICCRNSEYSASSTDFTDESSCISDTFDTANTSCTIKSMGRKKLTPFATPSIHSRFRSIKTVLKKSPKTQTPKRCATPCPMKPVTPCERVITPRNRHTRQIRHTETQTSLLNQCSRRPMADSVTQCKMDSSSQSAFASRTERGTMCSGVKPGITTCPLGIPLETDDQCQKQITQCPYTPPSINTCPRTVTDMDFQEFDSEPTDLNVCENLNVASSFCFHCLNAYDAVIKKFLISELQKLTCKHNKTNVILTTTLQRNGLYHINISLKPNGEHLGCLYANKQAIMEASREEEFKHYLKVFVSSDPKAIDEHQSINFDIEFASYAV